MMLQIIACTLLLNLVGLFLMHIQLGVKMVHLLELALSSNLKFYLEDTCVRIIMEKNGSIKFILAGAAEQGRQR